VRAPRARPAGRRPLTARRTPRKFTEGVFQLAYRRGLRYVHGRPVRLTRAPDGAPAALDVQLRDSDGADVGETTIACTGLVLAAGPWTGRVLAQLALPPLPVTNLPGHSIIVRAPGVPPTAVFASLYGANRAGAPRTTESPELFPRADGTVYVAGENNAAPLPDDPAAVDGLVDDDIAERLVRATAHISLELSEGVVETRQVSAPCHGVRVDRLNWGQLCYRPTFADGRPAVGKLQEGVWVATGGSAACSDRFAMLSLAGHGPWGITLATGTGKVVAELVLDGKASSADISNLSPSRFAE
jgi:glycine/D-amino acid oxidase-like deaminating enzyme